jgi:hypothetical protein
MTEAQESQPVELVLETSQVASPTLALLRFPNPPLKKSSVASTRGQQKRNWRDAATPEDQADRGEEEQPSGDTTPAELDETP